MRSSATISPAEKIGGAGKRESCKTLGVEDAEGEFSNMPYIMRCVIDVLAPQDYIFFKYAFVIIHRISSGTFLGSVFCPDCVLSTMLV